MRLWLTREADADIARILRQTRGLFWKTQALAYADIIERGVAMIAENPSRPSFLDQDSIRPGVKSLHLEVVAKRRNSASHLIYFQEARAADGGTEVIVLGVVHESMLPKRKLGMVLRILDREEGGGADPSPPRK